MSSADDVLVTVSDNVEDNDVENPMFDGQQSYNAESQSDQSSDLSPSLGSYTKPVSQATIALLVMLVMTEMITLSFVPKKNLSAAVTASAIAPLSIEWFKFMVSLSRTDQEEKKELEFTKKTAGLILSQYATLAIASAILLGAGLAEHCSPLGFRSALILTAFVERYLVAEPLLNSYGNTGDFRSISSESDVAGAAVTRLLQEQLLRSAVERQQEASQSRLAECARISAFLMADYALLFCATTVGGTFLEAMHIPLTAGVIAAGVTHESAIVTFATLLNMGIGAAILSGTNYIKNLHVNPISRLLTMLLLVGTVQATGTLHGFYVPFIIAALSNTVVQLSGVGEKVDAGFAKFFGNCKNAVAEICTSPRPNNR